MLPLIHSEEGEAMDRGTSVEAARGQWEHP